jgi:hypothetical protein
MATGVLKISSASEFWEKHTCNHPGLLDGSIHSLFSLPLISKDGGNTAPCLPFTVSSVSLTAQPAETAFVNGSKNLNANSGDELHLFVENLEIVRFEGFVSRTLRTAIQHGTDNST